MDTWITPSHQVIDFTFPLNLEDKIIVFYEQTYGWQLDIADKCINGRKDEHEQVITEGISHSGYAVLNILFSYFEMIAKYKNGFEPDGQSKHYFKIGLYDVFPPLNQYPQWIQDEAVSMLYEGVRCGLYHAGITQSEIILTETINTPIALEAPHPKFLKRLYINPYILPKCLKDHLSEYVKQLRDVSNVTLRHNFEKRFDVVRSRY